MNRFKTACVCTLAAWWTTPSAMADLPDGTTPMESVPPVEVVATPRASSDDDQLTTPQPFKMRRRSAGQGRFAAGISAFGPSLSFGAFIRPNDRTIHEVALDGQSWFGFFTNVQLTYGYLTNVSQRVSIGLYLGAAWIHTMFNDAPGSPSSWFFPAGGFRMVVFSQDASKNQSAGFFGLRVGFPTVLQLEGGYAF
ncbi:MAG: hypothetical protein ACOYKZ_03880 [Chlamydiia bacterium]